MSDYQDYGPNQPETLTLEAEQILWQNVLQLPAFRALLRAVESSFYQTISLPSPTIDLGCGDGQFAQVTFRQPLTLGLDPERRFLQEAIRQRGYRHLVQADAACIPCPDAWFASGMSNSVLEHIPDVEAVLQEVARVLKPNAPFIFCVPNHTFLAQLSVARGLDTIGLRPLGRAYRAFFNRISRHVHCDPPEVWCQRLEQAGFGLEKWWHYFPPEALCALEWGHYFGLPSLISKWLFDRWILLPTRWSLQPTYHWLKRRLSNAGVHLQGVYTFYIARRLG